MIPTRYFRLRSGNQGLTQTAAKVACKQLGFLDGVASTTPCSAYGGSNVCGASGSAVAMKALKCTGVEATVQECAWSDPDAACMTHLSDSVIFCTSKKPGEAVAEGSLRLIGASGPQFSSFVLCKLQCVSV